MLIEPNSRWLSYSMQSTSYLCVNKEHFICLTSCMPVCVLSHSRVWLFATLWTVARQVPLSMEFSRQEYWSGLPFPYPGNLPNPGIEPRSPALQADSLLSDPLGKPLSDLYLIIIQEWKWAWPAWAGRGIHKVRFFFPQCHAQRHIPLLHHFISYHPFDGAMLLPL